MSHSNLLLPDFFAALIDKYCCKTAVASGENINRISAENCASLESPWNSTAAATVFETRGKKLMLSAQLALSSPQGEFHWVVEVALVEKCPPLSKKRCGWWVKASHLATIALPLLLLISLLVLVMIALEKSKLISIECPMLCWWVALISCRISKRFCKLFAFRFD